MDRERERLSTTGIPPFVPFRVLKFMAEMWKVMGLPSIQRIQAGAQKHGSGRQNIRHFINSEDNECVKLQKMRFSMLEPSL